MSLLFWLWACSEPPPRWDLPAPPRSHSATLIVPFDGETRLRRVSLGDPFVHAGQTAVPTGYGVWFPQGEVATPGWATAAVSVSPDVVWVADNAAGLTVLTGASAASFPLGTVTDLAAIKAGFLATTHEGRILSLEVGPDGQPTVRAEQAVDGWPSDIAVDGERWAAAVQGGGVVSGTHQPGLALDGPAHGEFASVVSFYQGELSAGDPTGAVRSGQGLARPGHPVRSMDGPWRALGRGGLFHLDRPVRQRAVDAVGVRALAEGVQVTWADGTIEQLSADGTLLDQQSLGLGGAVRQVSGAGVLCDTAEGASQLFDGQQTLLGTSTSGLLGAARHGDQVLAAAEQRGVLQLKDGAFEPWKPGNVRDLAFDDAGTLWYATASEGVRSLDDTTAPDLGWRADVLALGPGGPASADWASGVLHLGTHTVKAPGNGPGLALQDGLVILGLWGGAIAWAPIEAPTRWSTLTMPRPMQPRESRICVGDSAVYVTLSDQGVARLRIDGSTLRLVDVADTPGLAVDCHVHPSGVQVADTTGLVLVEPLPHGG